MANLFGLLCRRTQKIDDIDEAIEDSRQSLKAISENHPEYPRWLDGLQQLLQLRHKQTGDTDSLEEAIRLARQAVQLTPKDHPDLDILQSNLGDALQLEYKRTAGSRPFHPSETRINIVGEPLDIQGRFFQN